MYSLHSITLHIAHCTALNTMVKAIILILIAIALLLCGGVDGDEDGASTCGLYLAKSTIPGAGLGVFTGVPHQSKLVLIYLFIWYIFLRVRYALYIL